MTRFEILIEVGGVRRFLDTFKEDPISITYNVADILDIDKVNSSYSKTIKIPETKNNREIFGDISDLGVSSSFNPNKRTKAFILVNTIVVMEGFLQLRKVIVNKDSDKREYEVVIYADNDNFFKEVGERFLTDLDFTELNHIWNEQNIVQSWTSSYEAGYFYPLIDYGYNWSLGDINGWTTAWNTQVKVGQMYPSTNVKYIWNKIFENAGYNYQSEFLDSIIFESLYIPFCREELVRDINSISNKFSVGILNAVTYSTTNNEIIPKDFVIQSGGLGAGSLIANNIPVHLGDFKLPFNNESAPFGDPDGLYNTSTFLFTAPAAPAVGRFVCDFDITWRFTSNLDILNKPNSNLPLTSICFKRSRNPNTGLTVSAGYVIPINGNTIPLRFTQSQIPGVTYDLLQPLVAGTAAVPQLNSVIIFPGPRRVTGQIASDVLDDSTINRKKLQPGEQVWVELSYGALNSQIRKQFGNSNLLPPTDVFQGISYNTTFPIGTPVGTFSSSNIFYNVLTQNTQPQELIEYSTVLPPNFKQRDFLTSIIKMFNLIVEPSKTIQKTLIIEPKDDYYAAGVVKDWTEKIDINQPIEEQILAETQNVQTNLRYKDDKDIYNEDYKNNHGGISYGEFQFFIDNDFISGQKKIENSFSPTPLVPIINSTQFVIPKIGKVNNNVFSRTEHNARILTRYNSSTDATWPYSDYQFNTGGQFNAFVKLTTDGFTNTPHPNYQIGDWIKVSQADGGVAKPALEGQFKIVEIIDTKTIVINLPFSSVGAGATIGGITTPLNGLLPTAADTDAWQFEGVKYKAYPYLGHFDNPQSPSYDLNYGQTTDLYYPEETVTNNNLYSSYWENTIEEVSHRDSRIITASFYLTAFDISDFRFNDKIFINGQYFKVNKIMNYDPTKEALVKIELIKSIYNTIQRPFIRRAPIQRPLNIIAVASPAGGKPLLTTGFISLPKDAILRTPISNPGAGLGTLRTSSTNIITRADVVVAGRDNEIYGQNIIVSGNTNRVSGDRTIVQGNENEVEVGSEGLIVLGNYNRVENNTRGSIVVGDRLHVEDAGVYIEQNLIVSANQVDAGRDSVSETSSSKSPNYISASIDEVREVGSADIINYISGGRFEVE